jgi:histidyl-tRNA synthetase
MTADNRVYKPKPISGFPEWLPEFRAVELEWLDRIRRVFESYGFCNIETPAVEEVDALIAAKGGDTQNEIYVLDRLYADKEDQGREARLALHFDLTVPMARYVAQNFNALVFPFKRYQLQKSYRGERPQKGRYREFYQCDIDIVNVDALPLQCDADLAAALLSAYKALDIPPVVLQLNNRKIVTGFLKGLGVADTGAVTRTLDKLDKIGDKAAREMLAAAGLGAGQADACLALVSIRANDGGFAGQVRALGVSHPELDEGIEELSFIIDQLAPQFGGGVLVNLGIIRGLDYYTGTVMEVRFADTGTFADLSIGGGGRYENLASAFINQKLPGVGASLGLTRLFGLLLDKGLIRPGRKCPTDILVILPEETRRAEAAATANTLRARGFNVELYHRDGKMKNQLAYAEKKNIPYVWFPPFKDGAAHEVKDMAKGSQSPADPATWEKN